MPNEIFLIKMPVGDPDAATATDKRFRLGTDSLDSDPDSLYQERLLEIPDEIGFGVSFLDDPELGGASFMLLPDDLEDDLLRTDHRKVGKLTSVLEAGALTMDTDITSGGLANSKRYIAGEVVKVGTHVASGTYNITRGQLGTIDRRHPKGRALFSYMHLRKGQLLQLYRVDSDDGYSDEALVRSYRFLDVEGADDEVNIEVEDLLKTVYDGEILRRKWKGRLDAAGVPRFVGIRAVSDAEAPDLPEPVPPPAAGVSGGTQEMLLSVEGKLVVKAAWEKLGDGSYVVTWNPAAGPQPLNIDADLDKELAMGAACWECVVVAEDQPASASPATDLSLPYSTNRVKFIRSVITTSPGGKNGTVDLGKEQLGLAVTKDALDLTQWARIEARWDTEPMSPFDLGVDGKPVKVGDLLANLWRPMGLILTYLGGKIAPVEWRDVLNYNETVQLLQRQCLDRPRRTNNESIKYGTVEIVTGGYLGQAEVPVRVNAQDDTGAIDADAEGLEFEASGLDAEQALAAGLSMLERYRNAPPIIDVGEVEKGDLDVDAGMVVEVTHAKIRGVDGKLGVTGHPCLVMGRAERTMAQRIKYTLAMSASKLTRTGFIAPMMRVQASDGATTGTTDIAVYRQDGQDGDEPDIDPDSFGFTGGDAVLATDSEFTAKYTTGLGDRGDLRQPGRAGEPLSDHRPGSDLGADRHCHRG